MDKELDNKYIFTTYMQRDLFDQTTNLAAKNRNDEKTEMKIIYYLFI